jgi:hypothetical protein
VPKIGESANVVRETSKLGGTRFIWLFRVGMFTSFKCGLVDYCEGVKRYSVDIQPPKWKRTICYGHIKQFMKILEASMQAFFKVGRNSTSIFKNPKAPSCFYLNIYHLSIFTLMSWRRSYVLCKCKRKKQPRGGGVGTNFARSSSTIDK